MRPKRRSHVAVFAMGGVRGRYLKERAGHYKGVGHKAKGPARREDTLVFLRVI